MLPFYPLLKFGTIYVTWVLAAAAVSVLGAMGTIANCFGWDMDFNGTELKSYPPKKKHAKAKTKTKKDIAINNLPVCLGRVLCVLAAVLSHC